MPKIICISDTHTKHDKLIIDSCDILIHAGDFSFMGRPQETTNFLKWFESQPATHRIFISGNHDFMDQNEPALFQALLEQHAPTSIYLRNEGCEVKGIKIWGRPITPTFFDWAFMADPGSPMMLSSLSIIPSDTDILINHGPAHGILDRTKSGENVGCKDLKNELERLKLKYHIFGHIHESPGQVKVADVTHVNASVLNERYINANKPIIINY